MQGLRRFSIMLFLVALSAFIIFMVYTRARQDTQGPKIRMTDEVIEASVKDKEETLLEGVTAKDARDGDVTDSLLVENLSNFTAKGRRLITYAAFDSHRNVGKATRELRYTDYESPKFIMKEAPKISQSELSNMSNFTEIIQATDCLDGDITRSISIMATGDYEETEFGGKQVVRFQVANSAGDVENIPVTIAYNESGAPVAELSSYIVYLDKGDTFDPNEYLKDIRVNNRGLSLAQLREEYEDGTLTIKNGVNPQQTGVYQVIYTVTVGEGTRLRGGMAYLQVVVRD